MGVVVKEIDLKMNLLKLLARRIYSKLSKYVLEDRDIRHHLPSMIYSQEDLKPSEFLINLLTDAATVAWKQPLTFGKQSLLHTKFINTFPGEHYRLLAALVKVLNADTVVEIGTHTGAGCLALKAGQNPPGKIFTYDVISWDQLGVPSLLTTEHFDGGGIVQLIGDLSKDAFFEENFEKLNSADLIFMDAPKDGIFEYKMLDQLAKLENKKGRLLVIDDIRFVNMIDFWRQISSPKLDATGFGHWSGTGLVDLSDGLSFVRP